MELNTNDIILAQNKLLTEIVGELTKKLPKLPQNEKKCKNNHNKGIFHFLNYTSVII